MYILQLILIIVPILISVAYITLLERKLLSFLQIRQGPVLVGFYGLLQPLADGVKLFLKEYIIIVNSLIIYYIIGPILFFSLSLILFLKLNFSKIDFLFYLQYDLLFFFIISILSVLFTLWIGYSTYNQYSILGILRLISQMISYEVVFGIIIVCILLVTQSFAFYNIYTVQFYTGNNFINLFPVSIIFIICSIVELNRLPFDLLESESELVSGYNVEYNSIGFIFLFLGEYINIMFISILYSIIFLNRTYFLFFIFKSIIIVLFILYIRGVWCRYRFDHLMSLCWSYILPFFIAYLTFELYFICYY